MQYNENLPYPRHASFWRASTLLKQGLPIAVYPSVNQWFGVIRRATLTARCAPNECAFASDAASTTNYTQTCDPTADASGCHGQCPRGLLASHWVSLYMNSTSPCFGLPCGFMCASGTSHEYLQEMVSQEAELWRYLFSKANESGFVLSPDIDPYSHGAWNEEP